MSIKSARGPRSLVGACLVLLVSLFPAGLILQGFQTGEVPRLGRRCHHTYSALRPAPVLLGKHVVFSMPSSWVLFVAAIHVFLPECQRRMAKLTGFDKHAEEDVRRERRRPALHPPPPPRLQTFRARRPNTARVRAVEGV